MTVLNQMRKACVPTLLALGVAGVAQAGTITIESWRIDDKALWENVLIPAFQKAHPGITVKFTPTAPPEYNSALNARLTAGTAGDLITCRPFDVSLDLYQKGRLQKLNGHAGLANFPDSAKVAWQTDNGQDTYCMPMASVIHGFFYNKKVFADLGLQPPKTEAEFFADARRRALMRPESLKHFEGAPRAPDTTLDVRRAEALMGWNLPRYSEWLGQAR